MADLQSVLDLARIPLNDADKDRYSDADALLPFLRHGLLAAYRRRPDLFIGQLAVTPSFLTLALVDPFPLPDEYIQVFADWVTARAETVDDEHVNSQRAAAFFALFGKDVS